MSVLHVHGRNDNTVRYEGGSMPNGMGYPGAVETLADWAAHDRCSGDLAVTGRKLDLDRSVAGDETVEQTYSACPGGVGLDLWTIEGGGHVPPFNDSWAAAIWSFMTTHPKVP